MRIVFNHHSHAKGTVNLVEGFHDIMEHVVVTI